MSLRLPLRPLQLQPAQLVMENSVRGEVSAVGAPAQ
jgi:hypothetical protein